MMAKRSGLRSRKYLPDGPFLAIAADKRERGTDERGEIEGTKEKRRLSMRLN